MKNLENIAEDLFNKIRGRFPNVTIGDENGQVTNVPQAARYFDFEYKEAERTLGKVSISIDEDSLSVMYSDNFVANENSITQNNWYDFLKELRQFSKKRMLNFDTRNITKSNLNRRDYKFLATNRPGEEQMTESTMYGTNKTSFQKIGKAKLSIKHSQPINTESSTARSQKIGKIYIESPEGERFKYPFKHLSGARAMARHVAEGGTPYDDFGKHIVGLSEELSKLRKFKTYMGRSSVMAESLKDYVSVVAERMETIRKDIVKLQKESFYKEAFEGFEAPIVEDVPEDVAENWIDQLTIKQFNEELQDVFPYIYKLVSEATRAKELGPDDLNEGIIDWIKGRWQAFQQSRDEERARYDAQLQMMTQIMQDNGMDDYSIRRLVNGCLNDPRVCMYNHIRRSGFGHKFHNELQDVYQDLRGGLTTRSATTDETIENEFEELLGQFSNKVAEASNDCDETCPKSCPDCGGTGDPEKYQAKESEMGSEKPQTPLSEFILSYFDYTTGQFPKGETAILTMVEKDYGERYINPAKQFIEKINNKVAEVMGYRDDELTDESALQAHIGRKKYGKEGMAKLAQAGREGASEEELGRIKDQYAREAEDLRRLAGL